MFAFGSKPPGVMIAAPRSGSGKTTVTLGLLRALKRRGLAVQPFKCGPDYIDPAFHEAACGRPSYNLDSWAMRREAALSLLGEAQHADFIVIEALMGLFDGVASAGAWGNGASADVAGVAGLPVLLVIDISGQAQTAAAVARGFVGFDPNVEVAGVVLNRVASPRHERLARAGFERIGLPVLGAFPRRDDIGLPERHLGLVQASETLRLSECLDALADLVEAHIDVGHLLEIAAPQPVRQGSTLGDVPLTEASSKCRMKPPGQRIALAQDAAFSFIYPHLLKMWREEGAEILPFSPLADETPASTADVLWLPGGYPELYAGRLASNQRFLRGTRAFAANNPVHGECGGYMVLGQVLTGADGQHHAMLGLLGLETSFASRKLHLGYRKAKLLSGCVLGNPGEVIAGHEFHYATIAREEGEKLFDVTDAEGTEKGSAGLRCCKVTGSFFHAIDKWE